MLPATSIKSGSIDFRQYLILISSVALGSTLGLVYLFDYSPLLVLLHFLALFVYGIKFCLLFLVVHLILANNLLKSRIVIYTITLSSAFIYWLIYVSGSYISNIFWNSFFSYRLIETAKDIFLHWLNTNPLLSLLIIMASSGIGITVLYIHYKIFIFSKR